jgi:uncharacterized membrane protein/thiol-disulfide isomerase/thioredoxin
MGHACLRLRNLRIFFILVFLFIFNTLPVRADEPVIHAVLFYSPYCPHCIKVISEDLPPLVEQYGDRLQILAINLSEQKGVTLYRAAVDQFQIPGDRRGVPTLIVGTAVLVGSAEIPAQFPGIIESLLAQGGVDWPPIPGLAEVVSSQPTGLPDVSGEAITTNLSVLPATTVTPTLTAPNPTPTLFSIALSPVVGAPQTAGQSTPAVTTVSPLVKFQQDLYGNILSVVVLVGMFLTVIILMPTFWRPTIFPPSRLRTWLILLLSLVGLGIAGYLTYIETTQAIAACGPVGDCNTVQQSQYARLFGVLPVGVLGLVGDGAILLAWIFSRVGGKRMAELAAFGLLCMTLFGVLFSIYLTYLEPFVIGATCIWCLGSAVVMTGLFILAVPYYWSLHNWSE